MTPAKYSTLQPSQPCTIECKTRVEALRMQSNAYQYGRRHGWVVKTEIKGTTLKVTREK